MGPLLSKWRFGTKMWPGRLMIATQITAAPSDANVEICPSLRLSIMDFITLSSHVVVLAYYGMRNLMKHGIC